MRKQKIYLETTLFNFYFDEDREAHPTTVKLFGEVAAGKYEAFTSTYVADELKKQRAKKPQKCWASLLNMASRYSPRMKMLLN